MTTLHLVRHGQSSWNAEGRVLGQTAWVPLTDLGHEQAVDAARRLRADGADALVTSDLLRAVQTAEAIGAVLGLVPVLDPALREQSLGALEGRLASDLRAEPTPEGLDVTDVAWGGGESIVDVHARVGGFLARLLADPPGKQVVLVSHGDAIRVALAWLAGRGPREVAWADVPPGSVTSVTYAGGAGGVVSTTRSASARVGRTSTALGSSTSATQRAASASALPNPR